MTGTEREEASVAEQMAVTSQSGTGILWAKRRAPAKTEIMDARDFVEGWRCRRFSGERPSAAADPFEGFLRCS
ncbi:hypothetical protein Acid7E03_26050 [Acidisoma sp. 7E03]